MAKEIPRVGGKTKNNRSLRTAVICKKGRLKKEKKNGGCGGRGLTRLPPLSLTFAFLFFSCPSFLVVLLLCPGIYLGGNEKCSIH